MMSLFRTLGVLPPLAILVTYSPASFASPAPAEWLKQVDPQIDSLVQDSIKISMAGSIGGVSQFTIMRDYERIRENSNHLAPSEAKAALDSVDMQARGIIAEFQNWVDKIRATQPGLKNSHQALHQAFTQMEASESDPKVREVLERMSTTVDRIYADFDRTVDHLTSILQHTREILSLIEARGPEDEINSKIKAYRQADLIDEFPSPEAKDLRAAQVEWQTELSELN